MEDKKGLEQALYGYAQECTDAVMKTDFAALAGMADLLVSVKNTKKRIFTLGNGGSAATASHICNDLLKGCRVWDRPGFDVRCLNDSLPIVTCLSNDFSYGDVFRIQLETYAHEGDILLAFSGSGNSENAVRALETAKAYGLTVLSFLGRDGGKMKALSDICVVAPTDCMEMIEDMHMLYAHALASAVRERLKDEWGAQIIRPATGRRFKAAMFDVDGTVNIIRRDWHSIIVPIFADALETVPGHAPRAELEQEALDLLNRTTGQPTVIQCGYLDEMVVARGGKHVEPEVYFQKFITKTHEDIEPVHRGLADGSIPPEQYRVPGCREFIDTLEGMGIKCYLASGSPYKDVMEEAHLLDLDTAFSGSIRAFDPDNGWTDPKHQQLEEILATGVKPEEIVCFDDAFYMVVMLKKIGGYAVGLATDERRRKGVNDDKRQVLLGAGADVIIPDFKDTGALLRLLNLA